MLTSLNRVKLPKTFLAVNLSDAFTFQEKQHHDDNNGEQGEERKQEGGEQEAPRDAAGAALQMPATQPTEATAAIADDPGADPQKIEAADAVPALTEPAGPVESQAHDQESKDQEKQQPAQDASTTA